MKSDSNPHPSDSVHSISSTTTDSPAGSVKEALTAEMNELGWRLNVAVDPKKG